MCQSPQILCESGLFQKFALSWILFKQNLPGELFSPIPVWSVEMFVASAYVYFTLSVFSAIWKQKINSFKWS